jgi:signal peptidase I
MDRDNSVISDTHLQAVLDIWNQRNEHITCSVIGNCMSPVIKEKDTIIIESGVKDISVGDIVVFGSPGSFLVKRVVHIYKKENKIFFLTKGDKNITFCEPVRKDKIVGKVLEIQGSQGHFVVDSIFWKYLNYILAFRSYVHGSRRIKKTLIWRAINALFSLRSKMLPNNFLAGPFLWKGICRISRIQLHK